MKLDTLEQAIAYFRGAGYRECDDRRGRSFRVVPTNNETWIEVTTRDYDRFAWVYSNRNGQLFMRIER